MLNDRAPARQKPIIAVAQKDVIFRLEIMGTQQQDIVIRCTQHGGVYASLKPKLEGA